MEQAHGAVTSVGSSPLTRGAPRFQRPGIGGDGLIPAHAGSTRHACVLCDVAWAHPRSRGEHNPPPTLAGWSRGSSPLTRGARNIRKHRIGNDRLIPAHAGSTAMTWRAVTLPGAHPRSRGEHLFFRRSEGAQKGSSPLTRGALRLAGVPGQVVGLIPAHAGSTTSPCRMRW